MGSCDLSASKHGWNTIELASESSDVKTMSTLGFLFHVRCPCAVIHLFFFGCEGLHFLVKVGRAARRAVGKADTKEFVIFGWRRRAGALLDAKTQH